MAIWRIKNIVFVFLATLAFTLTPFAGAYGQWVAPRGEGSVSIEYARYQSGEHIFSDLSETRWKVFGPAGHDNTAITGNTVLLSVDYTVYDRLALSLSVPFMNTNLDVGTAHQGSHSVDTAANFSFQDLGVNLRYMALTEPFFLTANIGTNIPTHDYGTHGHAAIGRNLRMVGFGLSAARLLSPILDNVYLQGNYSYSFTEEIEDTGMDLDRSNFSVGLTYFPPVRWLSAGVFWNHQITHGGLDWSDPAHQTHQWGHFHDRLSQEIFGQIGGNISAALTDRTALYGGYFRSVTSVSANTQKLSGFTFGTTNSF